MAYAHCPPLLPTPPFEPCSSNHAPSPLPHAQLVAYNPSERLSAADALKHPWLSPEARPSEAGSAAAALSGLAEMAESVSSAMSSVGDALLPASMLDDALNEAINNTNSQGFTEAQLAQEFGWQRPNPEMPRNASQTIAWFQGRESELARKKEAEKAAAAALSGTGKVTPIGGSGKRKVGGAAAGNGAARPASPAGAGGARPASPPSNGAEGGAASPPAGGLFAALLKRTKPAPADYVKGANGKPVANGNGKAAVNGNGKAAANGNGKAAVNGNGANGKAARPASPRGSPAGTGTVEVGGAAAAGTGEGVKEKLRELVNVFGNRN